MSLCKSKYILATINGFSHDLFTGLAICSATAIFWLKYSFPCQNLGDNLVLLNQLGKIFALLFGGALLLVILTGAGRLFFRKCLEHPDNQELLAIRQKLLILKHILLTGFFLYCFYLSFQFLF